jgi:hypothetical protein
MNSKIPNSHESLPISTRPVEIIELAYTKADLGPQIEIVQFESGRFSNAIQRTGTTRHARQLIREDMTSSFILNLDPDKTATICRGWRYLFFNDGPGGHSGENIREQMGYKGHWEYNDKQINVDVTLDDSVCDRVGEYGHLIPDHASRWRMCLLPVVLKGGLLPNTSAVICRPVKREPQFGEDEPHLVGGILPGRWLVLGAGNGLRIRTNLSGQGRLPSWDIEYSSVPIQADSWQNSF